MREGTAADRLLKNSMITLREPQGERDNLEVTSKYPFMLSLVEACSQYFNSLVEV